MSAFEKGGALAAVALAALALSLLPEPAPGWRAPTAATQPSCPDPSSLVGELDRPLAHVRYLADDALQGRSVATPGARCAADYIAAEMERMGLEPGGAHGSWFHTFEIRGGTEVGPDNLLRAAGREWETGVSWVPLGFSQSEDAHGPLLYAAYGISRPGEEEAEFHREVTGRIVVVEHGDPDSPSGRSVHADPHFKATLAAARGAVGVVVLLPDDATLPDPTGDTRGAVGLPVAAVRDEAARALREAARREEDAFLRADVTPVMVEARNVVGLLPGSRGGADGEVVVVGAHYDHLGLGGAGSLAPNETGAVHNGADDNASGTAALLEAAEHLVTGPPPQRGVIFIAFTGEERGLWGSAAWVRDPVHSLERTVAMLNLDMVGRLDGGGLTVYGLGTAEEWDEIVDGANRARPDPLASIGKVDDGFGPSDHASFHARGIPVLHFFTNTHSDYHRPSDDWEKIDADGLRWVGDLVADVIRSLAGGPDRMAMTLTPRETEASPHGATDPDQGPGEEAPTSTRGYGPYLGTVPDMTPSDSGVRLTGVREGSPAEDAGIRGGDVVVEFAGREITDLYAYTYALRAQEPGDRVEIVVERDGERVTLTAVLGRR